MKPIQGLHHITAVASDPQANVDFYVGVLGQRLVKTTVNFDDPGTYHLYYGDEIGTLGTAITFFPWRTMHRGRIGSGETSAMAYAIPRTSIEYWRARLTDLDIPFEETNLRFDDPVISLADPDGMVVELVATDDPSTIQLWKDGPIPEEHALRGFHSVTLLLNTLPGTAALLTEQMGYDFVGQEGSRFRFCGASNDRGLYVDIDVQPDVPRGSFGAGSIHHVAFRTVDDSEQLEYMAAFRAAGQQVTSVQDRQYFHSIYFRGPGGVLFEVATDEPGFLIDESIEELGSSLKLPSWYESKRDFIEKTLPPIDHPDFSNTLSK
ncbi:MAG: ring-cleaving dioxygenase [Bacteroidetes bacterium]|nr:ring-cleaving dioxygenase [Bacteroidota bacterium]